MLLLQWKKIYNVLARSAPRRVVVAAAVSPLKAEFLSLGPRLQWVAGSRDTVRVPLEHSGGLALLLS